MTTDSNLHNFLIFETILKVLSIKVFGPTATNKKVRDKFYTGVEITSNVPPFIFLLVTDF